MSLMDDARKMLEVDFIADADEYAYPTCIFCFAEPYELPPTKHWKGHPSQPHADDCPSRSMTKIVAALEAAERYVSLNGRDDVSMTDIMHAEDDLHAAFGHARRYDVEEIKT